MKTSNVHLVAVLAAIAMPESALAYVGPGAGLTLLGALWGVLMAVVLAITGVVLWPLRALLARRRHARKESQRLTQS
jgi:type VI protein secretion system component VasK